MLEPGELAPPFSLPGVHDGAIDTFELDPDPDGVVVVAFYPMDFSPACTEELCAIREAELFAIAEHVRVLAVSADSVFAHRAFAREHDLTFPLLTDRLGDVAESYGVLHDELQGHERVPKRAVFVVDTRGTIRYAWSTDDPTELPDIDEVVRAVRSIQDDEVASELYATAHRQYSYGNAEFERARGAYAEEDWAMASESFGEAQWYLDEASGAFDRARRFAPPGPIEDAATTAADRTRHLEQAATWFGDAAEEFERGAVDAGEEYEADATEALELAEETTGVVAPDELGPCDGPEE